MQEPYQTTSKVSVAVSNLQSIGSNVVKVGDGITVAIQVLPKRIGAGTDLTVVSRTPSILSIAESHVQTNEEGIAYVTCYGELPGEGVLQIVADDTTIETSISVSVLGATEFEGDICATVGHNFIDHLCMRCGMPDSTMLGFSVNSDKDLTGSVWFVAMYDQLGKMLFVIDGELFAGQKYVAVPKQTSDVWYSCKCFILDKDTFIPLVSLNEMKNNP